MKAGRVMTKQVIYVSPSTPLHVAWGLMQARGFRHLPVLEGRVLVGIVSDRDFLLAGKGATVASLDLPPRKISEVMSVHPFACAMSTTVAAMAGLMLQHKVDALPIVDAQGGLLGLVTSSDLLELLKEPLSHDNPHPFSFELRSADGAALPSA